MALPIIHLHPSIKKSLLNIRIFLYKIASKLIFIRFLKCRVRIEIDNSELGVIGDFTTITALESLRLRLRDPNIANHCKISYNPSLVVVCFYIASPFQYFASRYIL